MTPTIRKIPAQKNKPVTALRVIEKVNVKTPLWLGDGVIDYYCGHCKNILAKGMLYEDQVKNIYAKCYKCNWYCKF